MALKLNSYKTITEVVPLSTATDEQKTVYTAPVGYTGVVLLAQVTNVDDSDAHTVTLIHRRGAIDTEIAYNFPIPNNDGINFIDTKLFLQPGDKMILYSSDTTSSQKLKFISSILETLI